MNAAYFIGAGTHTALGRGLPASIEAVHRAPSPPQRTIAEFAEQKRSVPYRLLSEDPPVDAERRLYRVLEAVIDEALQAAGLTPAERTTLGLFIGSSSADISVSEARYRRELKERTHAVPLAGSSSLGNLATQLCQHFGFRGPDFSLNTACTASANALVYADAMVRSGRLRHALVVGVELFNVFTAMGFHGLQLLAPGNMKPFDRARDGLVLGEGCSALVLGPKPRSFGAFRLRGAASICDTYSVSAAHPDGSTIAAVMGAALQSASLVPAQIATIKVHGTASRSSDEAEVAGMKRVFATLPSLCALKPFIGHTLGACGLNELLLFCAAAQRGFLIGTPGICANDSDLGVTLNQQASPLEPGNYMLNCFGFGGNNTSLIVSNETIPR